MGTPWAYGVTIKFGLSPEVSWCWYPEFSSVSPSTSSQYLISPYMSSGRLTVSTSDATIYGLQVVLGIGTGAFSQAGFAIAQAMVDPTEIQNAISFMLIGKRERQ